MRPTKINLHKKGQIVIFCQIVYSEKYLIKVRYTAERNVMINVPRKCIVTKINSGIILMSFVLFRNDLIKVAAVVYSKNAPTFSGASHFQFLPSPLFPFFFRRRKLKKFDLCVRGLVASRRFLEIKFFRMRAAWLTSPGVGGGHRRQQIRISIRDFRDRNCENVFNLWTIKAVITGLASFAFIFMIAYERISQWYIELKNRFYCASPYVFEHYRKTQFTKCLRPEIVNGRRFLPPPSPKKRGVINPTST